ncbi:MAG: hypothetical protein ACRDWG_01795 [Actinomycetes bacterium]
MSRRQPRRRSGRPVAGPAMPSQQVESWPDGDWVVRLVTGSASAKPYRCPGCDHEIRPATPHVVAWPADADDGDARIAERRHWHRGCWRARDRRR